MIYTDSHSGSATWQKAVFNFSLNSNRRPPAAPFRAHSRDPRPSAPRAAPRQSPTSMAAAGFISVALYPDAPLTPSPSPRRERGVLARPSGRARFPPLRGGIKGGVSPVSGIRSVGHLHKRISPPLIPSPLGREAWRALHAGRSRLSTEGEGSRGAGEGVMHDRGPAGSLRRGSPAIRAGVSPPISRGSARAARSASR